MEQRWRVYAQNTDIKRDLRFMVAYDERIRVGSLGYIKEVAKSDSNDDLYRMIVNKENVEVVSRDANQQTMSDVLRDVEEGVFIKVSDKNFREVESRLTEILNALRLS